MIRFLRRRFRSFRNAQPDATPRRFVPAVELLEQRELLATSVLQGTVFVDGNANGTLTAGDTRLTGATVELVDPNNPSNVIATTTTDANGNYQFIEPTGITYRILAIAPAGYHSLSTQTLSQLNPATSTTS